MNLFVILKDLHVYMFNPETAQCGCFPIWSDIMLEIHLGGSKISVGKYKTPGNPIFWSKPCPIFKISRLAVSFQILSWVLALKKWNLVARQAHFLTRSWFLAESQKIQKKWAKSKKLKIRIGEVGPNGEKYHRLAPEQEILKKCFRAHAQWWKMCDP